MGNGILKKGQATLEASLAFVVVIVLLGVMVRIWFWANNQIVERQISFNAGRVLAGTSSDDYNLKAHWPVYAPPALNNSEIASSPAAPRND